MRIPIGPSARRDTDRYRALRRARQRGGEQIVEEATLTGLRALDAINRFESNAPRWHELLELADRADAIAESWRSQGVAQPTDVADLFDRAFEARSAVLEARFEAGLARCRLLEATGVNAQGWPRLETPGLPDP